MVTATDWRDYDKIRQQFDYGPYPRTPLEQSAKESYEELFSHNLVTAYYLRHRRVTQTEGKLILDAGCGSGYHALILAEANPGAKIVGIDLSEQSILMARQRLAYHGFDQAEFHQAKLEEVGNLGLQFDYINCDEVLYLLPDPVAGLQALKSVLKPDGIIRTNLHSLHQRFAFYRAQALFRLMGLMENNPEEFEETIVIETMKALKPEVRLKVETWTQQNRDAASPEQLKEVLAMNFLFRGDTGYSMTDLFEMLEQADLDLISMTDWRHWDITELFQDPEDLPAFWAMSLASATLPEKLQLFELMHPVHRLLDFWCTHPESPTGVPVDDWSTADWQQARVHLHPQLCTEPFKAELIRCIKAAQPFEISQQIKTPVFAPVFLQAKLAACLLPLWESPQPIAALVQRYRQIHPLNLATLEPLSEVQAFTAVQQLLNQLDAFLYVLIEQV
ncbi:MAG: class I SAM-dependent methyltransferase [Pegethrix bostrychoides GSE-TBD4-15B]|jgi:SAM-dependent methyltransferase|uniref:Class I SAM-dependent methyltransferase n=1 Tax=Pegethrix bostrychoides GSE-TBD4-15B TaxID=2839662 RepID=A0A951P7B7_9CYAN|nr:class I SAM-dependent methyltransferase [Pegethrix bostrychoides GSE-TBD4-15B]